MTEMANGEWGDIPTTSELFGGDFFGDELMDMYAAIGDATPPPAPAAAPTSSALATAATAAAAAAAPPPPAEADGASHPGLLIAMNAAAMDGGLSPLGSGPEQFVPAAAPSAAAAAGPPPSAGKAEPAPSAATVAPAASVAAPLPAPVTSAPPTTAAPAPASAPKAKAAPEAKRPAPAAAAARNPAPKKQRSPAAIVPRARVAATGGIKVSLPPGAVAAASRPLHRGGPSSGAARGAARPPGRSGAAPPKKASVARGGAAVPRSRMPVGGGINHAVVARPSTVRSAALVASRGVVNPAPAPSSLALKRPATATASATASRRTDAARPPPPPGVLRARSEADFKDVASAAVTSLIQSASATPPGAPSRAIPKAAPGVAAAPPGTVPTGLGGAVDVSTAHVNALTSQNWVTACNPVPTPEPPAGSACDKAARNARRAALTQEERAKQNRDRNREHARNTRLRKKAYVEELKRTLTELVARRDAADLERRHGEQREREQREVRFRVMEEFLKLRGRNEPNAARWVAILEDGFAFTLPRTPFRRTVETDKTSPNNVDGAEGAPNQSATEQVLRGAAAVMEDSRLLSAYLQTLGPPAPIVVPVQLAYHFDRKRFFMDENVAFLDFSASTVGAAPREIALRGSARASFSPASNKLISVDIVFDAAAFLRQVEAGKAEAAGAGGGAAAAAQAAASEADALLDSLQMPQIFAGETKAGGGSGNGGPAAASVSSDDGERSTDGSALLNA